MIEIGNNLGFCKKYIVCFPSQQINTMESMPLSYKRGFFLVETSEYKESCLPHPKKILQLVNKHLAFIANEKNEEFLKILRVRLLHVCFGDIIHKVKISLKDNVCI